MYYDAVSDELDTPHGCFICQHEDPRLRRSLKVSAWKARSDGRTVSNTKVPLGAGSCQICVKSPGRVDDDEVAFTST